MNIILRVFLVCFVVLVSSASLTYAAAFQQGDEGQDVAVIQDHLSALGYDVSNDGQYGPMTANAVKAFQKDRGLYPDGIVGAQTYRVLMGRDIPVSRSDGSSTMARRVVQTALRYTGVPYMFGGTSPAGFDCSGYVQYVFGQSGMYLPRTADSQFETGQSVSYSRLQPGDLVFFSTYEPGPSHSGIYLGDGRFISSTTSRGVIVDRMDSGYWGARYIGARRVL